MVFGSGAKPPIQKNGVTRKLVMEKEFKTRISPLTDRYENNEDINSIYNLFTIILIGLLTNTIIYDYTKTGQFSCGQRLIIEGFNRFELVVLIWLSYLLVCFISFSLFHVWAKVRLNLSPKVYRSFDKISSIALIFYYLTCLFTVQKLVEYYGFQPGSTAIIILEQLRLLMKQHSFIRTNGGRVVQHKLHSDDNKPLVLGNLRQFIYFLFAPTLIYRDEYPRTQSVRWKFVLFNFIEVFGIILLLSLVVERFLIPPFENFGLQKFTVSDIVIPIVGNLFPGILFMLCGFYSVLHSAQNGFAEILTFGDRMFYREWWTTRSFSEYFRTWNVIVHDWLFTYIYKDMHEIVLPRNKTAAKLTVFLLSAIVHEWALTIALNLFLPIQFTQFFIVGALLTSLNLVDYPLGNLFVLYSIVLGSGMQVNLYTLEYFARVNCPLPENSTDSWEFFKPRFLTCGSIE